MGRQKLYEFTRDQASSSLSRIIGKTAGGVDTTGIISSGKNKGRLGDIVERSVFGMSPDVYQEPDLIVDGEEWELKVTGIVEGTRSGWRAKEPMSVTAVSPETIVGEEFATSAFWHKAERMLIVYYLYVRPGKGVSVDYASFEFRGYDFHEWSETDRGRIEADWTVVRDFVRFALINGRDEHMPDLSTLVNPRLLYLDTSPKWPNRPRFRLKNSLVTQLARECLDDGMRMKGGDVAISSMEGLDEELGRISHAFAGRCLFDIAGMCGVDGRVTKSAAERCVVSMFTGKGGKISRIPLFAKASILFQTFTLTSAGGRTEDLKLNPSIDFDELLDPEADFEDSGFSSLFTDTTLIVAVFREPYRGCALAENEFLGFKRIWLGAYLETARGVWDEMRRLVFQGELVDVPVLDSSGRQRVSPKTAVPMSAPNWPKSSDSVVFVRGSGADATRKDMEISGVKMYAQQNLWIRGKEVTARLASVDFI